MPALATLPSAIQADPVGNNLNAGDLLLFREAVGPVDYDTAPTDIGRGREAYDDNDERLITANRDVRLDADDDDLILLGTARKGIGNNGDNNMLGNEGRNTLKGRDGDDALFGGGSKDKLYGENGNDTLDGGEGADYLRGGRGDDLLIGGAGKDSLRGDLGNDTLLGGDDADQLSGGRNNDLLDGGSGDDVLAGGTGDDVLLGGEGADTLKGGTGSDTLEGGAGDDYIDAGSKKDGADVFVWSDGDGSDRVRDLGAGDKLDFTGADGSDADSDVTVSFEQVGKDTHVTMEDGSVIVLKGIKVDDLSDDNGDDIWDIS